MASSLQVIAQPASEPATIDTVRRHCRIDHTADDDLLTGYLRAARVMAERYLSRCLITQTLLYTVLPEPVLRPDRNFFHNPLELTRAPVQSITGVVITDADGNVTPVLPTTVPANPPPLTGYIPDLAVTPPRLRIGLDTVLADGRALRNARVASIAVTYQAGYGATAEDVPQNIIQAVLMATAHLYENRGDVGADLPLAVQWLLDADRMMWV